MSDDAHNRREEDRIWRQRTDERIAALTTGETVQNDRLDEYEERLEDLEKLARGDPETRGDHGLSGDVDEVSKGLNELRAIMAPDHLGQGGVNNRLRALEDEVRSLRKAQDNRWKFWTAIGVAFITSGTLLVREWPAIRAAFHPQSKITAPAPKKTKRVVRRLPPPPPPEPADETEEP